MVKDSLAKSSAAAAQGWAIQHDVSGHADPRHRTGSQLLTYTRDHSGHSTKVAPQLPWDSGWGEHTPPEAEGRSRLR